MKRFKTALRARPRLIALGLAVTAVAIAAPLGAGAASSSTGAPIVVLGSGVRSPNDFVFTINAHTPADSVGVYGTFSGDYPSLPSNVAPDFSGVVTCLHAGGNTVTVGGIITQGAGVDGPNYNVPNDLAGDWYFAIVQDPPGGQPDTMSGNSFGPRSYFTSLGYTSFSSVCNNATADPEIGTSHNLLTSGDIHIAAP
jgi:hypothetical protein